jgi:hypothetical protein
MPCAERRSSPAQEQLSMTNDEKIVRVNGVDLCVETFGDPTEP